jgi:hypothetical protein
MGALLAIVLAAVLTDASSGEGVAIAGPDRVASTVPSFGVHFDAGAPDGVGASLVATPWRYFRIEGGGVTNGVGSGFRLGVTLVAFPTSAFRPVMGVDGGYLFGGLGEWIPRLIEDAQLRAAMTGATVGFVNWQLGFDVGSKNVAFTLRAGVSYVDVGLEPQTLPMGDTGSVSARGIALRGFIPSARLGILFCFG